MRSNESDAMLTCVHRGTKALVSLGNRASLDPRGKMVLLDLQATQDPLDLLERQALQDKMDPKD